METVSASEFEKRYGKAGLALLAPSSAPPAGPAKPSLTERLASVGQNAADRISQDLSGSGSFAEVPRRAVDATAAAFSVVPQAAKELLPEPARNAVDFVGEQAAQGFKSVTDLLSSDPRLQKWAFENPDALKSLENVLGTGAAAGEIAGDILAVQGAATAGEGALAAMRAAATRTVETAAATGDAAVAAANELKGKVQSVIAKKTVGPQLEQSASRLFLDGTKTVGDPLKTYDDYLLQSQRAITDIKVDPAIASVGEEMGDAFGTVIKQRQAVGKVIGEELKTVGKLKLNVGEPKTTLLSELKESGLAYNPKTNELTSFGGSRFAPAEVKMLNEFVRGYQALGDTPTIQAIDNFIAKTRSTLQFTKGEAGVLGTTNAERIINGGIAGLKETLNPAKNGLPELEPYWKANQAYADLSDFVEEGSGYLGKVTQTGDFAKDASLAKSAVQSILNNGKKDWIMRLEALTGEPLLDKAVLALQAMKDAGDFRGLSLLESMVSGGSVPITKTGIASKILDYALQHGAQAVVGSAAEQTRRFLTDLAKTAP